MHQTAVTAADLTRRIAARAARIGIIGQGYVGLPLAVEFARVGFTVTGFDTSLDRVAMLNAGRSHTPDVPDEALRARLGAGRYQATTDLPGLDRFLAFSPERIDPANSTFAVKDIPKVVGGLTPECAALAALLYGQMDCVLILTDRSEFDYARIVATSALVVDTRGATHTLAAPADRVVAL
jgi:UDP-N-acetyl-D-mannosaminuronate dehydrogenase